jgi:glucan phosphoethanolaminetransferase (alkaline phosphatase superfamily)
MRQPAQVTASRTPTPVQSARVLLAAVAISHLAVAVVMSINQSTLRDQIATQHPDFDAAEVARSTDIAVTSGAVFHGILLVLCALLVWKLATARPWIRRLTTVSQLLSVVFSVVSWSSSPMFHAVIPFVGAALLWIPRTAREFFAKSTGENEWH